MNGLIIVNKPSGITSMKAVSKVRHATSVKRVGHMGTLDPMANGVLIVGVGTATRLFDYYLEKEKQYIAEFEFGKDSDTLDSEGTITSTTDIIPCRQQIEGALQKLVGEIDQAPPRYSAKHIDGVRAYDLARRGEQFELKSARVSIDEFSLIEQLSEAKFRFLISCSSGTYIRSLARDLAKECGSLAIMTALTRTKCGRFCLEQAVALEDLQLNPISHLIQIEDALELPKYQLDESHYKRICNGVSVEAIDAPDSDFLLYCKNEFFGIGANTARGIKIKTYLRGK